jgi:hypothetical protein
MKAAQTHQKIQEILQKTNGQVKLTESAIRTLIERDHAFVLGLVEPYLSGIIGHAIERARKLPPARVPIEFGDKTEPLPKKIIKPAPRKRPRTMRWVMCWMRWRRNSRLPRTKRSLKKHPTACRFDAGFGQKTIRKKERLDFQRQAAERAEGAVHVEPAIATIAAQQSQQIAVTASIAAATSQRQVTLDEFLGKGVDLVGRIAVRFCFWLQRIDDRAKAAIFHCRLAVIHVHIRFDAVDRIQQIASIRH